MSIVFTLFCRQLSSCIPLHISLCIEYIKLNCFISLVTMRYKSSTSAVYILHNTKNYLKAIYVKKKTHNSNMSAHDNLNDGYFSNKDDIRPTTYFSLHDILGRTLRTSSIQFRVNNYSSSQYVPIYLTHHYLCKSTDVTCCVVPYPSTF